MLDWPSRLLLAVTAALTAFAVTGATVSSPAEDAVPEPSPTIPAFALQTAIPAAATASPVATAPVATPTPTPTRPLTIALAGDVHGEPPIAGVLEAGENPFAGMADVLRAADLAVVNLETAIGDVGAPADKTFTFQADPALADAMAEAGVDVVNLANNHGLDHGHDGAAATVQHATAAGLVVVGYGDDASAAYTPHLVEVDGRTVAVVGLSRVLPTIDWGATSSRPGMASAYDTDAAVAAVALADELADVVVVTIHWGQERWICPDESQLALAGALARAGADVIAGHHPHVLQGVDEVDGALVIYSLGNFVFYARTPATRQTGVMTVTIDPAGARSHRWTPGVIDGQGQPQVVATQAPIPGGETLTATSSGPECGPPA